MFKLIDDIEGYEELKETNTGFRFLYNKDQLQSGAMLFIQWCLAPQVVQYLKDEEVTDAQVFITVRNPNGGEQRLVYPLAQSAQEIIEFHRPGVHTISGTVVWGPYARDAKKKFLEKHSRREYRYEPKEAIQESGAAAHWSFGQAELSVEVADGFFAPRLSAFENWYINLWYSEPPWDGCEISHRRWIAYTIQPLVLALWIPFICLSRFSCAAIKSVLFAEKNVAWSAVVHPFSQSSDDLTRSGERRWARGSILNLFMPMNLCVYYVIAIVCALGIRSPTALTGLESVAVAYGAILVFVVMYHVLYRLSEKDASGYWKQRAERKEKERMERLYSDLSCLMVPVDGTLRTRRRDLADNVILSYHNLKARMCRPTAQG